MNRNGAPYSPGDDKTQPVGGGVRGSGRTAHHHHQETQKDRGSDRVASSAALASRRQSIAGLTAAAAGRNLPSKWEDAERWICSPISGNIGPHFPRNRPKSKSGPMGLPDNYFGYAGQNGGFYSPAVPGLEGWSGRGLFGAGSPFSTGVLVADKALVTSSVAENSSKGVHRWLDDNVETTGDTENRVTCVVSRRDMATQMSPESSTCPSPRKRRTPTGRTPPRAKLEEVRDFFIDGGSSVISWSKRHAAWFKRKDSAAPKDLLDDFPAELRNSLPVDIIETVKNTTRAEGEEAKITAWENLQKAKAEAAVKKLEVELEKKRLASMDRILNKLRRAELRAQEMRSSILEDHWKENMARKQHFHPNILFHCFRCHSS